MKEFFQYVVSQLIDQPEELVLNAETRAEKDQHFSLHLPRSEVGKVIGKQGHTIRAIRNLAGAAVARHGHRVVLDIVERPTP